ncbi:carboxypeptidase regulatory-like domain-containing protein [Gemmatimonas sp.]|uniref:carboxypeptidase-like regulatory domain-containing protein n=1 Tax=Gemmatimonas sp. TaxID=1962908 RepID=UPI0039830BF4
MQATRVLAQSASTKAPPPPLPKVVVARVVGTVYDSLAQLPLTASVVQLVEAGDSRRIRLVRSDANGAFVFDSVPTGVYLLGFLHPRLDMLGMDSPLLRVEVVDGSDVRTPLALPSVGTLRIRFCSPNDRLTADGLFMGVVRRADLTPLDTAGRVRAQWTELQVAGTSVDRKSLSRYGVTSEIGGFAMCVPSGVVLTTRAFVGADSSGFVDLPMPLGGFLLHDLYVGAATRAIVAGRSVLVLQGAGRIRGTVRDGGGKPVTSARVELRGVGVGETTSVSGQFALAKLPTGSYTLDARAIGYQPTQVTVNILATAETTVDVTMAAAVATVDTLRVRANANRGAFSLEDFERRRKNGFGHFLDEAQLIARAPKYAADIFRSTPGMQVMSGVGAADRVLMRASGMSGTCVPAIFLNSLLIPITDGVLDGIIDPNDVRAVEIYSRTASMPLQFQTRNGCGSIVIWSGSRRHPDGRK